MLTGEGRKECEAAHGPWRGTANSSAISDETIISEQPTVSHGQVEMNNQHRVRRERATEEGRPQGTHGRGHTPSRGETNVKNRGLIWGRQAGRVRVEGLTESWNYP